jgi:hypothetical protein
MNIPAQGMAALDSPGGMSLPPQQTSIRGASHTTGPGSVPSQGMQGGYITGPGSQHHIPSMNSPSVSHQQQYIMSSGQLMVTANNL